MKRQRWAISPSFAIDLLRTGFRYPVEPESNRLPEDARIVGCYLDPWGSAEGAIILVIESETFPEIDPLEELPWLNAPRYRQICCPVGPTTTG